MSWTSFTLSPFCIRVLTSSDIDVESHRTLIRIRFCIGSLRSGISFSIEICPQFNLQSVEKTYCLGVVISILGMHSIDSIWLYRVFLSYTWMDQFYCLKYLYFWFYFYTIILKKYNHAVLRHTDMLVFFISIRCKHKTKSLYNYNVLDRRGGETTSYTK